MSYRADAMEPRPAGGLGRLGRGLRRLAARALLGPVYAELEELRARQHAAERRLHALGGRAADQDALARRLGALEDAVIELREALPPLIAPAGRRAAPAADPCEATPQPG
jgi:hypothetical protein